MHVAVIGLWHLGVVTAACLANVGYQVVAYDEHLERIASLQKNRAPIFEPDLEVLIKKGQEDNHLLFSHQFEDIQQADIIWITYDTPVDDEDNADIEYVKNKIRMVFPHLKNETLVLISSQLPVGTVRTLLSECTKDYPFKSITFACIPENLRLGKAIHTFKHPDRFIVGLQHDKDKIKIQNLLQPFTTHFIWMSLESAEMTKHALNAFLATSIVFINEIAILCEKVGANAKEVERGLKSEERIGEKAYLRPGNPIGGGTLVRDVNYLLQIEPAPSAHSFFSSVIASNEAHKYWVHTHIRRLFSDLKGKRISTLGLTYKANTDTLRRSTALETCYWLKTQGADVTAYDPKVNALNEELAKIISLKNSWEDALYEADAMILATEWPEFAKITADRLLDIMKKAIIFDIGGFLAKTLETDNRIHYFALGRGQWNYMD